MKKIVLALAAFALAFTAVPAFASVQNVKVYGNIDTTFLLRENFSLGSNDASSNEQSQNTFITQTRLGVDADLTDNVAVTVGLINERAWNTDAGNDGFNTSADDDGPDTRVNLYLAYVTLREMLYSPLTVIVGRQQWGYGNKLVFDATGANNVAPSDSGIQNVADDFTYQTALDAVRAILDYNPLTLEFFYAVPHQGTAPTISNSTEFDTQLKGVNATYALGDEMDSVVEGYFIERINNGGASDSDNILKVTGLRASTNPIEGLNLQIEFAKQFGHDTSKNTRQAYAAQGIVNYKLPVLEDYKPVAQYTLTKVSGEKGTSTDGRIEGWDAFYEAQGFGTIYNQLFDLTNLVIHSASLEATPLEDLTAKASWNGLWRESKSSALTINDIYSSSAQSGFFVDSTESEVGQEVDFSLSYAYTEDVTIGTNLGWFFPGNYFERNNDSVAKQAIVSLGVAF